MHPVITFLGIFIESSNNNTATLHQITATLVLQMSSFPTGLWGKRQPVTSSLNSNIMSEARVTAGAAAHATELRKHEANDVKCSELGWLCIPLVVESYGAWGKEAMESFSSLASRLAITSSRSKSAVLSELYDRLNLNLVRANMRVIMILPSRLFLKCYLVLVMFSCVLYVL